MVTGLIMNISKVLIICWSIVWSATIFSAGTLLNFKIFIGLVGLKTIKSGWFILTVATYVFIIWAFGCSIILIGYWAFTRKKEINIENKKDEPVAKKSDLDPDIQELLNKLAQKPK